MNKSLYLSRSFVEFGPFPTAEVLSFYTRGLLKDSDYVGSGAEGWVHVEEWAAGNLPSEPPAPKVEKAVSPTPSTADKEPAPAPAAKKAAPAKKAAVKKAKKSA